jgi:hypothetical protein
LLEPKMLLPFPQLQKRPSSSFISTRDAPGVSRTRARALGERCSIH